MAHFTGGFGFAFAVEVDGGAFGFEGFSCDGEVGGAEEVEHYCGCGGGGEGCGVGGKWEVNDCADVSFVLGRWAGFDSVVA